MEDIQQLAHVVEMQPGGRLIQDIERLARPFFHQLARQLDPLRLAAGKRRRGLPQLDVIETDVVQGLQHPRDLGDVGEMLEGFLNVHVEHVADAAALESHVQRLAAKPLALADRAGHPDVSEEVHLQAVRPVAVASLAPAPRDVEAEPPRRIAASFRIGQPREQIADLVEQLDVGRRVRSRRAADRRLIDVDNLVEMLQALDPVMCARAR